MGLFGKSKSPKTEPDPETEPPVYLTEEQKETARGILRTQEKERSERIHGLEKQIEDFKAAIERSRRDEEDSQSRVDLLSEQKKSAEEERKNLEKKLNSIRKNIWDLEWKLPDAFRNDEANQRKTERLISDYQRKIENAQVEIDNASSDISIFEEKLVGLQDELWEERGQQLKAAQTAKLLASQHEVKMRKMPALVKAVEQALPAQYEAANALDTLQDTFDMNTRLQNELESDIEILERQVGPVKKKRGFVEKQLIKLKKNWKNIKHPEAKDEGSKMSGKGASAYSDMDGVVPCAQQGGNVARLGKENFAGPTMEDLDSGKECPQSEKEDDADSRRKDFFDSRKVTFADSWKEYPADSRKKNLADSRSKGLGDSEKGHFGGTFGFAYFEDSPDSGQDDLDDSERDEVTRSGQEDSECEYLDADAVTSDEDVYVDVEQEPESLDSQDGEHEELSGDKLSEKRELLEKKVKDMKRYKTESDKLVGKLEDAKKALVQPQQRLDAAKGALQRANEEANDLQTRLQEALETEEQCKVNGDDLYKQVQDVSKAKQEACRMKDLAESRHVDAREGLRKNQEQGTSSRAQRLESDIENERKAENDTAIQVRVTSKRIELLDKDIQETEASAKLARGDRETTMTEKAACEKEYTALKVEQHNITTRNNELHVQLYLFLSRNVLEKCFESLKTTLGGMEEPGRKTKILSPVTVEKLTDFNQLWRKLNEKEFISIGHYTVILRLFEMMGDQPGLVSKIQKTEDGILRPCLSDDKTDQPDMAVDSDCVGFSAQAVRKGSVCFMDISKDEVLGVLERWYETIVEKLEKGYYNGPRGYLKYLDDLEAIKQVFLESKTLGDQKHEVWDMFLEKKKDDMEERRSQMVETVNKLETLQNDLAESQKYGINKSDAFEKLRVDMKTKETNYNRDLTDIKFTLEAERSSHDDEIKRLERKIETQNDDLLTKEAELKSTAEKLEHDLNEKLAKSIEQIGKLELVNKNLYHRLEVAGTKKERRNAEFKFEKEKLAAEKQSLIEEYEDKLDKVADERIKDRRLWNVEKDNIVKKETEERDETILKLRELNSQYSQESEKLTQSLNEIKDRYLEKMNNMDQKVKLQIERKERQLDVDLKLKEATMNSVKSAIEAKVRKLEKDLAESGVKVGKLEGKCGKLEKVIELEQKKSTLEKDLLSKNHGIEVGGLEDRVQMLRDELERLTAESEKKWTELKTNYDKRTAKLKLVHQGEVDRLRAQVKHYSDERQREMLETVEKMKKQFEDIKKRDEAKAKAQAKDVVKDYKAELNQRTKMEEEAVSYKVEVELAKVEVVHRTEVQRLETKVGNLEAELKSEKLRRSEEVSLWKSKYDTELKMIEEQREKFLDNREAYFLKGLDREANSYKLQLRMKDETIRLMEGSLAEMKTAYEEETEARVKSHSEFVQNMEQRHNAEVERISVEFWSRLGEMEAKFRREIEAKEQQVKECHRRYSELNDKYYDTVMTLNSYQVKYGVDEALHVHTELKGEAENLPQNEDRGSLELSEPQGEGRGCLELSEPHDEGSGSLETSETQDVGSGSLETSEHQDKGSGSLATSVSQDEGSGSLESSETQDEGSGSLETSETQDEGSGSLETSETQGESSGSLETSGTQDEGSGSLETSETQGEGRGSLETSETQGEGRGSLETSGTQGEGSGSLETSETQGEGRGSLETSETQGEGRRSLETSEPQDEGSRSLQTSETQDEGSGSLETSEAQGEGSGSLETSEPQDEGSRSLETSETQDEGSRSLELSESQDEGSGSLETSEPQDESSGSLETSEPKDEGSGSLETSEPQDEGSGSLETSEPQDECSGSLETSETQGEGSGSLETSETQDEGSRSLETSETQDEGSGSLETSGTPDEGNEITEPGRQFDANCE